MHRVIAGGTPFEQRKLVGIGGLGTSTAKPGASGELACNSGVASQVVACESLVFRSCSARVPLVFRLYSYAAFGSPAMSPPSPCEGLFVATGRAAARHIGAKVW